MTVKIESLAEGALVILRDVTAERELVRRRDEMQRLVSHELKTPLASLAGFGGMLERYQMEPEELQRVARLIRSESERLGAMVAGFLDLENLGAGLGRVESRPVDLSALVGERCAVQRAAALERQQVLTEILEPGAVVDGVARLLALLLDNLVGNALKHTPEGAGIEVRVFRDDSGVHLSVRDDGPGIDGEVLPRIFDRFFRGPGASTPGTGLGLALVREVADWHGACVGVDSTVGEGTTFRVDFPVVSDRKRGDGR
jgi:signal transduction histidine kinase